MMTVPSSIPMCDMAKGIASTPAPTIVLTRLMTLLRNDAWPAYPVSFLCRDRRLWIEEVLVGREPCSLGEPVIAA